MAEEPHITPQDLYGPSNPPVPEGVPVAQPTPKIPVTHTPTPTHKPKGSFLSGFGALIMFIGLFAFGMWLSNYLRQYVPNQLAEVTLPSTTLAPEVVLTPSPLNEFLGWIEYLPINGKTKQPVPGISLKLPPDVVLPVCDTVACLSQGTYLAGGTRLTIAPRGEGQMLADFRGSVISDAGGVAFTTADTTVSGHKAKLFTGTTLGKTVGGYGFTQIRGYMIEVTDSLSLEISHFTPNGVQADFAKDDTLFDQIVGTLSFTTPSVTP